MNHPKDSAFDLRCASDPDAQIEAAGSIGGAMRTRMPPTAFLCKSGRRERLHDGGPSEFAYGFAELHSAGARVELIDEVQLGLDRVWPRVLEAASARLASLVRVHPRLVAAYRRVGARLGPFECVVATTQSVGLALAALKRCGLIRQRLFIMTMGLIDADVARAEVAWLRWLLRGETLAALSKPEAAFLRDRLGGDVVVADFVFGVDLGFWTPGPVDARDDVVLSVGNDWNRDFAVLVQAWRNEFPPLQIITSLSVPVDKSNVTVERGDWRSRVISDEVLRDRLRRARLVIVPVRETLQPSGQSAALQAMACGRPVILSANCGLWDRPTIERHAACRLVPPGQPEALAEAVATLLAFPSEAEAMGARARRMLETNDISAAAMAVQVAALVSPNAGTV